MRRKKRKEKKNKTKTNPETKHPLHRVYKTGRKKEGGEEEEQPYFPDEVRYLFPTASSQTEPECPTVPDV